MYYRSVTRPPKVRAKIAEPIMALNEESRTSDTGPWPRLDESFTKLVRGYGFKQEFITPHSPQQSGLLEGLIRSLKEQCVHRQRFETEQHAPRAIGAWIQFYNHRRPHQDLQVRTPVAATRAAFVAQPVQEPLRHYQTLE